MRYPFCLCTLGSTLLLSAFLNPSVRGLELGTDFIPRKQSAPPGPPLSPQEAMAKMTVPEGFRVELVASEPDLLNPVAMAFDDRGRIFVTESFEYPRREPGPGRDRIKILEDKDGDGVAESVKIFAEGLNIPSGIAIGHGGVWVANAPDILFLEDTDGDDRADKSTVVATGFGRDDTHELPNALTWGPDGALYGLNGVFNPSQVKQGDKTISFTCAMFRIDPKTHHFELFCEGTSNPWGIAFDHEGSAFVSACVIDHLWHLTESAYYRRQAGPYPPHTFFAESIVEHNHQMAAYCGIEFVDTDAYPSSFNNKLYMGNIHGGCINSDSIERRGATYRGTSNPDFMTANDVWFMPVAQKVGPDGCLYVLDWYDRYHCYQDANADPVGVDRGHGRLYRIVHQQRPQARVADFGKLTTEQLIGTLSDPNIFNRQRAQLKLQERTLASEPSTLWSLLQLVNDDAKPLKTRLHALWAIAGSGSLAPQVLEELPDSQVPEIRAWAIRTIGSQYSRQSKIPAELLAIVERTARDSDPRVRVEVSIASLKIAQAPVGAGELVGGKSPAAWNIQNQLAVLANSSADPNGEQDPILSRIVWQNMLPHMSTEQNQIASMLADSASEPAARSLLTRFATYLLATSRSTDDLQFTPSAGTATRTHVEAVLGMTAQVAARDPQLAAELLSSLMEGAKRKVIPLDNIKSDLAKWLEEHSRNQRFGVPPTDGFRHWNRWESCLFQCHLLLGDSSCVECAKNIFEDRDAPASLKRELLSTANMFDSNLVKACLLSVMQSLREKQHVDEAYRDTAIELGIGKLNREEAVNFVQGVPEIPIPLQARIAERLCQRAETTPAMLELLALNKVRRELISPNTIRILSASNDPQVQELVRKIWGTVNIESTKEREAVVDVVAKKLASGLVGDAERGWVAFDRTCGQCHVMHGRGAEVGPNITANGRGAFDQMLVSVFNPSLVIGEAYKGVKIRTVDEEVIAGLLVDRNELQTVVRLQGGKERVVPANEIDEFQVDTKSLMPEGLETQLSDQELADLFALLSLEKAPGTVGNAIITGTPEGLHSSSK